MSHPPQVVEHWTTTVEDPDEAAELIGDVYGDLTYRLGPHAGALGLRIETAGVADLRSARLRYGIEAEVESGPVPALTTAVVLRGSARCTPTGGRQRVLPQGSAFCWVSGAGLTVRYSTDAEFATLQIPFELVAAAAQEASGLPAAAVRLLDTVPVDAAAGRFWTRLMGLTHQDLCDPRTSMTSPLLRQHWQQTLARAALVVFPNSTHTAAVDHLPGAGAAGPRTVRRAAAYAEAHAADPIGVVDMAQAAGVGVRALQIAFARHVGHSPARHLRTVRLARVHRELADSAPDAGVTVAAAATRWGFGRSSRFVEHYRDKYGESPGETLRK